MTRRAGAMHRRWRVPVVTAGALLATYFFATLRPASRGEDYWVLPVPLQGPPPSFFSPLEASLNPQDCGSCHPKQFNDWKTSLHSHAMSSGVLGQIRPSLQGQEDPEFGAQCLTCHAPLSEQAPFLASVALFRAEKYAHNRAYQPDLLNQGVVCAACHLRQHQRFGPPPREPASESRSPFLPHGGFSVSALFTEAQFCAPCHQHNETYSANHKPIMNTYEEWRASPFASRGIVCQDCHMPDRRHLWRGIHDPEQVRKAITTDFSLSEGSSSSRIHAVFRVTNSGAGHFFPTYVTPTIFLKIYQIDASMKPIPGTLQSAVLRREVAFDENPLREISDTRLAPGESFVLRYSEPRSPSASAVVAEVVVSPDDYYIGVYEALLNKFSLSPRDRSDLEAAYERALSSSFSAVRRTLSLRLSAKGHGGTNNALD